jgi:hypothetical protein
MTSAIQRAVERVRGLLAAETGLAVSLAALEDSPYPVEVKAEQVTLGAVSAELLEKAGKVRYPLFAVYCNRVTRDGAAKLGGLSEKLRVVVEIRMSQDRLEGLQERLLAALDAVGDVLDRNEGCLDQEAYLSGKRDIEIEAVKHGGSNYLQTAKVTAEVIRGRG